MSTEAELDLHHVVAARLADHEQQYTSNRRAVVEALAVAGSPITLPGLLEADESLAQSSAYRSLAVLLEPALPSAGPCQQQHLQQSVNGHLRGDADSDS